MVNPTNKNHLINDICFIWQTFQGQQLPSLTALTSTQRIQVFRFFSMHLSEQLLMALELNLRIILVRVRGLFDWSLNLFDVYSILVCKQISK
jgi:hypothetical protein